MAEVHPRAGKRKLEEECLATEGHGVEKPFEYVIKTFIGKDGEEYYDSDDDEIRYADGGRMSVRHQKEYYRQIRESEGFDITLDLELGKRICASFMTQRGEEKDPLFLQLSHKAIEHFNSEHNTHYKFVEIVTLNTSPAAGIWCYITFLATDSDDSNASKTFQALVWRGINKKIEVRFCRLKKLGDKKPLDSDIDVKATQ
ncbi:multicystatin isoform X1 [Solanum stenotomum]|uniref:multicystatin isoform X1 n=1 Tax=Solanum stenotomum TaxID=172797 RepID=UPI0020D05A12|nr:multicystatin isoform X1 [Solanum stenotomum]